MEEMDFDEFKKKYMTANTFFDFSKFKIICKVCGSDKVEFGGELEVDTSSCYYDYEFDIEDACVETVCKCHNCGNAFKMKTHGAD